MIESTRGWDQELDECLRVLTTSSVAIHRQPYFRVSGGDASFLPFLALALNSNELPSPLPSASFPQRQWRRGCFKHACSERSSYQSKACTESAVEGTFVHIGLTRVTREASHCTLMVGKQGVRTEQSLHWKYGTAPREVRPDHSLTKKRTHVTATSPLTVTNARADWHLAEKCKEIRGRRTPTGLHLLQMRLSAAGNYCTSSTW